MVTLRDARDLIAAAERRAQEIGQPMNIAVVDAGGNLIAHVRMDGAWMGSIDISIKKAWTSRAFDIATKDLARLRSPAKHFFGIHVSNRRPGDDLRRRHAAQAGRQGRGRDRGQWRQRRAGPCGRGGRRRGVRVTSTGCCLAKSQASRPGSDWV